MTTPPDTPDPQSPAAGSAGGFLGLLARVRGRVRREGQTLWAARSGGELMDTVAEIEALKSALDAVELQVVAELEATRGVNEAGWASTRDFVTAVTGGSKASGPATVRLATATAGPVLAPVAEALGDGWLSTTKAHVINRAVETLPLDPDLRRRGVQVLLGEAKALDATDLATVGRHLVTTVDPDGEARRAERELDRLERAAHVNRHLSITDDGAGGAWLKGRCSAEDAAQLKTTLIPLAAPPPTTGPSCDPQSCTIAGCGHQGRDPRDHGARMLDALVEACRRLQTADLLPESHGAVPRVTITMSLEELQRRAGFGTTETGQELSATTVRRLCCDAEIIPVVLGGCGEVLDVGRQQRLTTAAIWKALVARDRHCRFTRCTRPPVMCHAHHIEHWLDDGPTCLENLMLLCGHHHRLVHAGPWRIRVTGPASFTFDPPARTSRHLTRPDTDPPAPDPPDPGPAPPDTY